MLPHSNCANSYFLVFFRGLVSYQPSMLQNQNYVTILFWFTLALKLPWGGGWDLLGNWVFPKMQFICLLHVLIKCTMVISYVPNLFPQESDELTYKTFERLEEHSMVNCNSSRELILVPHKRIYAHYVILSIQPRSHKSI